MTDQAPAQSTPQSQAPVQTPDNNDRIAEFGARFLQDLEDNTDPNQNTPLASQEQPAEEAPEAPEAPAAEAPEDAESPEDTPPPAEELEVAEYDGKQYQVPKEIKKALMLHADYTRKTQEISERNKQLDRTMQASHALFEQAQQFAPLFGRAQALEQQLAAVKEKLTPEFEASNPYEYLKAQGHLATLYHERQELMGFMQQTGQKYRMQQEALKQQALEAAAPSLQKDIPGFGTQEVQRELAEYAQSLGYTESDFAAANWSPAIFKTIWKAKQFDKQTAEQAKKVKEVRAKVQSLPSVKPTGRQPAQSREGREQQLTHDWKRRGGKLSDPALDAMLKSKFGG